MPSFTGEEAARIVEHWLEIIYITCTDNEEFERVHAIGDKFMQYYNLLNKRITKKGEEMWALTDEDKKARLAKKADALQVIGNDFLDLYVEGPDPESVTHYGWTGQQSSSGFCDRPPATLGVFASLDRF
jgi:hypothetical protein